MSPIRSVRTLSKLVLAAAGLPLPGSLAQAQLTNAPAPLTMPASGAAALSVVRVFGALALVLAVFFGGLWVFRNWQRFRVNHGRAPKLSVIETRSLGPRHTLYVIGYERERLLVAASPSGVAMLTGLPQGEPEVETRPAPAPAPATVPVNFGAILQALASKL